MTASPVKRLHEFGQSPWLDFIQRGFLESGGLGRMIRDRGVSGVTSNPVIFENAIAHTEDYRAEIERLARTGRSANEIYESLILEDVRTAADLLRPVYRGTDGADGFVSLEVSPHLARDASATVSEAKRLWSLLDRPNVMIKVPGTREGLIAIRSLLGAGVNVNVTLLFSIDRYREVLDAYYGGLEDALGARRSIDRIASVASFFLSRIDTKVDAEIDAIAARGDAVAAGTLALRGKVAIASARVAYAFLDRSLASERFRRLRAEGAQVQRLLWASTSTKDPTYSPIKYVEPLIGPNTVSTMPLQTLEAYEAFGKPGTRLTRSGETDQSLLDSAMASGVDLARATARLLEEGVDKFASAHDSVIHRLNALVREESRTTASHASHIRGAPTGR